MSHFQLKDGMLLGVATAATQIEGGDEANSWFDWFKQGKILDGSSPARANDHYRRWQEDLLLMREMGIQIYRFGVEWSRIEPENGHYDESVIRHYREEIQMLRDLDIRPLLTLHHFTNPLWFEQLGGFENPDSTAIFLRFVDKVVRSVGDLVDEYITINEPNVYAVFSYAFGTWPPGKKSLAAAFKVMSHLASCHIQAYSLIHAVRDDLGYQGTRVSCANHIRSFAAKNPRNPWHRFSARMMAFAFQEALARACLTGRFPFPLRKDNGIRPGKYYDFLAVDYYTRSTVSGLADGVADGAAVNDLGWEIYPKGIVDCTRDFYSRYPAPVFITENGTCDNNDVFRSRYIFEHLKALCESDLPVERYYHWCFCDNFEWLDGESARFGLVHVDYPTQKRTIKESGRFFAAIIRDGGVSEELYDQYARQVYRKNDGGTA